MDAPHLLNRNLQLVCGTSAIAAPIYVAGQLGGTEGYCEAIRSGLHAAISAIAQLRGIEAPELPATTAFGALLAYATDPQVTGYQPMHVNFGLMPPLDPPIRNKRERYKAYADRGAKAIENYASDLKAANLIAEEQ